MWSDTPSPPDQITLPATSNTQQRRFYDFEAASWETVPRSR